MIIAQSSSGIKRRIVYSSRVLCVEKTDRLSFFINDEQSGLETTISFVFSDEGEALQSTLQLNNDGKELEVTLHKWYSTAFVENNQPLEFNVDASRLWIKFRTQAVESLPFRSFEINIWGEVI